MLHPAPTVTETTRLLPLYLLTAGEQHQQEERIRPQGAAFHHLFFVFEGEMLLETPQGKACYPAGTALLIPKDLPTRYGAAHDKLISGWIAFDGTAIASLFSYFKVQGVQQTKAAPLLAQYELCVKAVKKGQSHEQLSALFYPLLLEFFLRQTQMPTHLQTVKSFIDQNFEKDLSVSDMAQAAGISPSLLFRLFEKEGTTPLACLQARRIEQARRLLLKKNDTVAQVGAACGFHDRAYFCKVFRRHVGLSPMAFRRSFL